jgi:hypothetical protein
MRPARSTVRWPNFSTCRYPNRWRYGPAGRDPSGWPQAQVCTHTSIGLGLGPRLTMVYFCLMAEVEGKAHQLREPLWHVQLAVAGILVLQMLLPGELFPGPKFILPALEACLLLALIVTTPRAVVFRSFTRRTNAIGLIALISLVNIYSLQRLVHGLLAGSATVTGHALVLASINIYVTNIVIFGLWFWELDGGGPGDRIAGELKERDFLFPQMMTPEAAPLGWAPLFMDYLYVSVTNATAFSPTDTMPMSRRAKLLMTIQAFVSLVTIALVAARAVNILS